MRVLALLTAAAALALPGCLFGMCGPTVTAVQGETILDLSLGDQNRSLLAQVLTGRGFVVDTLEPDLHATKDGAEVLLQQPARSNDTRAWLSFAVAPREFDPDDGGNARADAYGQRMAQAHQDEAQGLLDALTDAAGAPRQAVALHGSKTVC